MTVSQLPLSAQQKSGEKFDVMDRSGGTEDSRNIEKERRNTTTRGTQRKGKLLPGQASVKFIHSTSFSSLSCINGYLATGVAIHVQIFISCTLHVLCSHYNLCDGQE